MITMFKTTIPLLSLALTCLVGPLRGTATAQTVLHRSVIAQGAVSASGGGGSVSATLGQPIIGTARASAHAGFFGFWYTPDRIVVNVERFTGPKPESASIESIYPNPAHGVVSIHFAVHGTGVTRVTVHDMLGRELCVLDNSFREAGRYALTFAPRQLAPGLYFVRLNTAGPAVHSRFIVAK
jgi:hypothetical protein